MMKYSTIPNKKVSLQRYLKRQLHEAILNNDQEGIKMTEASINAVKADKKPRKIYSEADKDLWRADLAKGMTQKEVSTKYGVSVQTISAAIKKESKEAKVKDFSNDRKMIEAYLSNDKTKEKIMHEYIMSPNNHQRILDVIMDDVLFRDKIMTQIFSVLKGLG